MRDKNTQKEARADLQEYGANDQVLQAERNTVRATYNALWITLYPEGLKSLMAEMALKVLAGKLTLSEKLVAEQLIALYNADDRNS